MKYTQYQVTNSVVMYGCINGGLDYKERAVLMALSVALDTRKGYCVNLSVGQVQTQTGLGKKSVQQGFAGLTSKGYLAKRKRGSYTSTLDVDLIMLLCNKNKNSEPKQLQVD